jgi:hypothetical protein
MQYAICVLKLKIINKPSLLRRAIVLRSFVSFGEGRISRSLGPQGMGMGISKPPLTCIACPAILTMIPPQHRTITGFLHVTQSDSRSSPPQRPRSQ